MFSIGTLKLRNATKENRRSSELLEEAERFRSPESASRPVSSLGAHFVGAFEATEKQMDVVENVVRNARNTGLPSKEERRMLHNPFSAAEPAVAARPTDEQLAALGEAQGKAAQAWQAASEADAPRRERVLQMKGCLDGQCCYMVPGQMQNGPSVYK